MSKFRFKQFAIEQGRTPLKVGTDGVLLGAWCSTNHAKTALDIGTGTGLIALMLAQRNLQLIVDAIEPNTGAAADALVNFEHSPWPNRLQVMHCPIQDFISEKKYDLIVCNPPFFIDSLPNPDLNLAAARHASSLSPIDLAKASSSLNINGIIAGIYPPEAYSSFHSVITEKGLFLQRICKVRPTPYKAEHRILFEYGSIEKPVIEEAITIEENGRHQYSTNYIELTKDFYLNF